MRRKTAIIIVGAVIVAVLITAILYAKSSSICGVSDEISPSISQTESSETVEIESIEEKSEVSRSEDKQKINALNQVISGTSSQLEAKKEAEKILVRDKNKGGGK